MVLIDAGNGKDLEFGHTDYNTGEGRFITHSDNMREKYINTELSVAERHRISVRDCPRRNNYTVALMCENYLVIRTFIQYNPATEALSLSWGISAVGGKKVMILNREKRKRISKCEDNRKKGRNRYSVILHCEYNTQIQSNIQYNPFTEALSLSWSIMGSNGKKLVRLN